MSDDSNDNIKSDYDYSRETYYDLIEKGRESLELMIEVARESEHPRAFEVLSGMIKGIADVNDKLMDLQKKKKDVEKSDVPALENRGNTTNNVFLGSTTELQRFLQNECWLAPPICVLIGGTLRILAVAQGLVGGTTLAIVVINTASKATAPRNRAGDRSVPDFLCNLRGQV